MTEKSTISAICLFIIALMPAANGMPMSSHSTTRLEQRLDLIDEELKQLAHFSLRSGIGSIGYRSNAHPEPHYTEWVEINLEREYPIDQVVLVPSIWRDTRSGFRADGFPEAFHIIAGTGSDTSGTIIATFTEADRLLPRIAPFTIPCDTQASWIRIEATKLSPRSFDGLFHLELSEIMVFSHGQNVALRKPVTVPDNGFEEGGARRREFLVDGFMPYLMDAARGDQSVAAVGRIEPETTATLTIDLETPQSINRIIVHSVDLSDTIPQSTPADFGLPRYLNVTGAMNADFSDAVLLADYRVQSVFDAAPVIMLNIPETTCRYVRIAAIEPYMYEVDVAPGPRVGFAEIEVYSAGNASQNVALNKPVKANFEVDNPKRTFMALTDGLNLYGNILPTQEWLDQLARRHDLEVERPIVADELNHRYARQKIMLRILAWIAGLLTIAIGFTILIDRMLRLRQVNYIRERFAADLHDELGANLHTIGLLSDLAEELRDSPDKVTQLHQRIRSVTERTGTAVRHCTDLLEADGLYIGLLSDMERAAQRIMAKYDHRLTIKGEEHLARLAPRTRADLFLFYKECLVNISRHADASKYTTHLEATHNHIDLTVCDNGRGAEAGVPSSLKRRARLLGAKIAVDLPEEGGTCIHLNLRLRRKQRI